MQAFYKTNLYAESALLLEYKVECEIQDRLMQDIYPDSVFSDCRKPRQMRVVHPFGQVAVLCVNAEEASCKEYEHPRQQGEVIGGVEVSVLQTQREQHADIISLLRNIYQGKATKAKVTTLDIHREYIQEHTNSDTND